MSRTYHHGERRIRVNGIRRRQPDIRKLAGALLDLARAQAEADAQAAHEAAQKRAASRTSAKKSPPAERHAA